MDFLYKGQAERFKLNYECVLEDNLALYSWYISFEKPDRDAAVEA